MPLISDKDRKTLQTIFTQRLKDEVDITYFTQHDSKLSVPSQECEYCKETRELFEEISELEPRFHLDVKDFVGDEQLAEQLGVERIPAAVLRGHSKGKVRFFGIPAGYEFSTLIEDLVDVSTGQTDLRDDTRKALQAIDQDIHIQVFVTPT